MRCWAVLLLFAFLAGCSTPTKVVRLDTGQGEPLVHVPRRDVEPVEVSEEEFKQAVANTPPPCPPWSGPWSTPGRCSECPSAVAGTGTRAAALAALARSRGATRATCACCQRTRNSSAATCCGASEKWGGGDCLRLLVDKPFLDGDAKYALAMAIAHSKVLGAMKEELARMVNPQAVVATVVGGLTMYAILLALPEPVSKGVAALLTLGAMAYLGWDTVWRLIDGWLVLMKEVDEATDFDIIYDSGEKFGDTMGEKAARAFVMLGTVAAGNTASGMAASLPKLPGAAQAAVVAEAQLGIRFTAPALAQVESVAISAEGATIALAPSAVAMAASGNSSGQAGVQAGPPHSGGPGEWAQASENMSEQARRYQAQVTGAPEGYVYRVKRGDQEVDFDGFDEGVCSKPRAPVMRSGSTRGWSSSGTSRGATS